MKKNLVGVILLFFITTAAYAQEAERKLAFDNLRHYSEEAEQCKDSEKEKAIETLRQSFKKEPYRYSTLGAKLTAQHYLDVLTEDGRFSDLIEREDKMRANGGFQKRSGSLQEELGVLLSEAFSRVWRIADGYRKGELKIGKALSPKVCKAILHYGGIEVERPNDGPRFHASCFAIPTATVNIYFCYLDLMERAEKGKGGEELKQTNEMLRALSLQAWTQPLRQDETDADVTSIARFRNHVWWVGGNALAYRSLLPVAAIYRSIPMLDVLSEVCLRGISMTSQNTYSDAFWTEGFTADGAGWGHGKQCLIWGYPIDGTYNALNILSMLKGSPWGKMLNRNNTDAILNFLRGGNWYYYNGYILPCLDRYSSVYGSTHRPIPYTKMLDNLLENWSDSFTSREQSELYRLQREAKSGNILMNGSDLGVYSGTRWFFNNDDLIKRTSDYHITVNMASIRCDGLESASEFADAYNFYTADGMTLFQRTGNEYAAIMGAWDVTASPGVTAREGMDRLVPVTNWRGYCSKHNFAAAATNGGEDAVSGFIYEKMNAAEKEDVNDRGSAVGQNEILYHVKAHKAYFMQDDYFIALGAGVTNLRPDLEGNIRTTIDQTALVGDVYLWQNGQKQPIKGARELTAAYSPATCSASNSTNVSAPWLVQEGGFAYLPLNPGSARLFVSSETRPTEWVKRNKSNANRPDLPANVDILRLWLDHGKAPQNDTYAYAVYAGKGMPEAQLPFRVLCNDTLVQAMSSADGKLTQAVFYPGNKGLQIDCISLTASAPCAVLIKQHAEGSMISVTDACMNADLKEIKLVWNGREITVPMPQGVLCGKPAVVLLPLILPPGTCN